MKAPDRRLTRFFSVSEKNHRLYENSELTQQREEEDGKTFVSDDKRERAITCESCRDLWLTLPSSGLLQKDLFKLSKVKLGGSVSQTRLLSRLSHKFCRLLSSDVLPGTFFCVSS